MNNCGVLQIAICKTKNEIHCSGAPRDRLQRPPHPYPECSGAQCAPRDALPVGTALCRPHPRSGAHRCATAQASAPAPFRPCRRDEHLCPSWVLLVRFANQNITHFVNIIHRIPSKKPGNFGLFRYFPVLRHIQVENRYTFQLSILNSQFSIPSASPTSDLVAYAFSVMSARLPARNS